MINLTVQTDVRDGTVEQSNYNIKLPSETKDTARIVSRFKTRLSAESGLWNFL